MPPLDPGAMLAAAFLLLAVLPGLALADRLLWLHTGAPALGAMNLDDDLELRGLCPGTSWVEVKEGRSARLFAYRCEDGTWFRPLPRRGQSAAVRQLWFDK